jgi:hypothetical protein
VVFFLGGGGGGPPPPPPTPVSPSFPKGLSSNQNL